MKASELRIGNLIYYSDEPMPVTIKMLDDIFHDPQDDAYRPIPLTDEWLSNNKIKVHDLDAGFYGGEFVGKHKESNQFYFVVDANDNGYGGFNFTKTEIDFVHELQNLHRDWYKEELKLKE